MVAMGSAVLAIVTIRFFTPLAMPAWTPIAVGVLLILLLQALAFASLFAFLVLHARSQPTFIPVRDYDYFVDRCMTLVESGRERRTSSRPMEAPDNMEASSYVGSELDSSSMPRAGRRVLRAHPQTSTWRRRAGVGAGLGGTSRFLCDGVSAPGHAWSRTRRFSSARSEPRCDLLRLRDGRCGTVAALPPMSASTRSSISTCSNISPSTQRAAGSATHLRPGGHIIVLEPPTSALQPFRQGDRAFRRDNKASLLAAAPSALRSAQAHYLTPLARLHRRRIALASCTRSDLRVTLMFWIQCSFASRVIHPCWAATLGRPSWPYGRSASDASGCST